MSGKNKILIFIFLVFVAALGRLVPHLWNATPLFAATIFAGVQFGRRYALLLPLFALILSDFFIGFYSFPMTLAVYASFAASGYLAALVARRKNALSLTFAAFSASTLFFFLSNTAVWLLTPMYSPGIQGLFESLLAGLPFYRNMLFGDLLYTALFFGLWESLSPFVRLYLNQAKTQDI